MDNPIDDLINGEPHQFKEKINNILLNKLQDRFEPERINIAQSVFASPEEDENLETDFEETMEDEVEAESEE